MLALNERASPPTEVPMKRFTTWSAIVATLALLIAPPAMADNYPVKDSSGTTQTFCSKLVGGLQHPCHLLEGLFSGTPTPISVDAGGNINVNAVSSVLPTGASTAANQTSVITQETAINTVVGTQTDSTWAGSGSGTAIAIDKYTATKIEAVRALLAASLALPTGAATSANQATQITSLASIVTNTTGLATSANQTTIDTDLKATQPRSVSAITSGGATPYHFISTASTNSTLVSTGAHTLYAFSATGLNTTVGYVRVYDTASAPTCSSATGASYTFGVIGSATVLGGQNFPIPAQGILITNGLAFCVTGGSADTDNTPAPAGVIINAAYK
jgi:hypothetical protein